MTNGEKLCIDFPDMHYTLSEKQPRRVVTTIGVCASFDLDWWNAEYKEPTTKKDCNTCTHNNETDGSNCYECVKDMCNNYEPTTKNDVPENNAENIYICSCGYGWDKSKVVRYHFCPNCGKAVASATKNDLGVDAVSRKDVHDMLENLPITVGDKWFNWLQKACIRLAELPSVTPQEPKTGHWIWCVGSHKCSNCEEYTCFSHKELLRYCPNCGAKMVEPQESEV